MLRTFIRRFARDEAAISALEFALVAPFLIALYIGSSQLTLGLTADRKVTNAANVIGDLVAQDEFLTNAELEDIYAAGAAVMQPYDATNLAVRVTSVRMDSSGDQFIDWSDGRGMPAYGRRDAVEIPTGILAPNNSVILVEVSYLYDTPFRDLQYGQLTLTDSVYLRPRRSLWVRRG